MTKDEIIETAKQAGFRTGEIDMKVGEQIPFIAPAKATTCLSQLCNFAALVATKEREECAKECESQREEFGGVAEGPMATDAGKRVFEAMAAGAANCAAAIRARGEQA